MNGDPTTAQTQHEPCPNCKCNHCERGRWLHALRDSPLYRYLSGSGTQEQREFWQR